MGYLWTIVGFLGLLCGVGMTILLQPCANKDLVFQILHLVMALQPPLIVFMLVASKREWTRGISGPLGLFSMSLPVGQYISTGLLKRQYVSPMDRHATILIMVAIEVVAILLMFAIAQWQRQKS